MNTKGMTVGDVKAWALSILHKELESIINAKSQWQQPYYILIIMKEGYHGPAAFGSNNELLHGESKGMTPQRGQTKDVDLSGKRVMSHRFILMNKLPVVPQIGSAAVYINNQTGQVKFEYILPPDTPMIGGFDVELESKIVANDGQNMPYVYGKDN